MAEHIVENNDVTVKPTEKNKLKLDSINKKILNTIQYQSDISNNDLAEKVGLSPAACSKRVTSLRQSGVLSGFHAEVDLEQICEHVLSYVEFTLMANDPESRARFAAVIDDIPEFMDCLRLTGSVDYISFTCCRNIEELNKLCDRISGDPELGVQKVSSRIIIDRTKWFLGYPIDKLKWLQDA